MEASYPNTLDGPPFILWRGHRYNRTPLGYYARGASQGSLHRDVYEAAYGPLPDGHEVHHVDLNPSNNDPSNLRALTIAEHKSLHGRLRFADPDHRSHILQRLHDDESKERAREWHASQEGAEWHSRMALEVVWSEEGRERRSQEKKCEQCGEAYQALQPWSRFCSQACGARNRRQTGRASGDAATCEECGITFTAPKKHRPTTCCSHRCAGKRSARKRWGTRS